MAVVIDQHHGFKPFKRSQRCKLKSLTNFDYNAHELIQTNILGHSLKQACEIANIHKSLSTPCFSLATRVEEEFDTNSRVEIVGGSRAPRVRALVAEVAIAMAYGVNPIPASSGLGGAYLLRGGNGENIAVAKPIDEEPLSTNNPKGFEGLMLGQPGMKRSVRVGETGIRELAAYLLDHDGFAGVPPTALVKIAHFGFRVNGAAAIAVPDYKIASLQRFVDHEFNAGELGASGFSVASVHRIGIFDVRILNLDRHAGNILVKKNDHHENYAVGAAELVPIDHGLCLPEWLDDPYFEWMHWPQASVPFSEFELDYISNLDPFKDAEILRAELPSLSESSIRVLILCTIFLKQAATTGLCLSDIGTMMTRQFCGGGEILSVLENLCVKAKLFMINTSNEDVDSESDEQSREEKEEFEIFQFDDDSIVTSNDVSDPPQPLECPSDIYKPPKIPRFSSVKSMPRLRSAALSPLYEENHHQNVINNDDNDSKTVEDNGGDNDDSSVTGENSKLGGLTRSMSYSVQNCNCETESVSLGDMNAGEWELFLECIGKLLPEVFGGRDCLGLKKKLGNSCEF